MGLRSLCNFSEFLLIPAYFFLMYCAIRIIIMLIMMYFNMILLASLVPQLKLVIKRPPLRQRCLYCSTNGLGPPFRRAAIPGVRQSRGPPFWRAVIPGAAIPGPPFLGGAIPGSPIKCLPVVIQGHRATWMTKSMLQNYATDYQKSEALI